MRNEVIFDDRGRPDILVVFTPDELKLPDTLKGRKVKEYAISKYPNTMIDGRPYSLPFMPPAVNVNHDEAIRLCEAKGPGWHLITNDEWAALARQSWENDTVPTGNTNSGKSHSHPEPKRHYIPKQLRQNAGRIRPDRVEPRPDSGRRGRHGGECLGTCRRRPLP